MNGTWCGTEEHKYREYLTVNKTKLDPTTGRSVYDVVSFRYLLHKGHAGHPKGSPVTDPIVPSDLGHWPPHITAEKNRVAELKTKKTSASVSEFLESVENEQHRRDSFELLKLFEEVTGRRLASHWLFTTKTKYDDIYNAGIHQLSRIIVQTR